MSTVLKPTRSALNPKRLIGSWKVWLVFALVLALSGAWAVGTFALLGGLAAFLNTWSKTPIESFDESRLDDKSGIKWCGSHGSGYCVDGRLAVPFDEDQ